MNIDVRPHPDSILNHFNKHLQHEPVVEHKKQQWEPYVNNGGTVIAVGLPKLLVVAGDTRISQGYNIQSRQTSKIAQLTDKCFLATSGMHADFIGLTKNLKSQLSIYELNQNRQASTESISMLLSRVLYNKRFFPFYTFNCLAGIDANNNGLVYGYDAIGSFDQSPFICQGSASELVFPILDNQLQGYNKKVKSEVKTKEQVVDLVLACFNSATERDIYTGDQVEMIIIDDGVVTREYHPLRRD